MAASKIDYTIKKIACSKCNKWVWIVPATGEYELHQIPERQCASGTRFY